MNTQEIIDDKIRYEVNQPNEALIDTYTKKFLEIEVFKTVNASTLNKLENLQKELDEIAVDLKEEAKLKGDMENEVMKVSVSERWKKYYDYDAFLAFAEDKELKTLKQFKGTKTEIDKVVLEECVNQGLIRKEVQQGSFKEELLSTAVLIKNKLK